MTTAGGFGAGVNKPRASVAVEDHTATLARIAPQILLTLRCMLATLAVMCVLIGVGVWREHAFVTTSLEVIDENRSDLHLLTSSARTMMAAPMAYADTALTPEYDGVRTSLTSIRALVANARDMMPGLLVRATELFDRFHVMFGSLTAPPPSPSSSSSTTPTDAPAA
jgi:hypothetical protein